MTTAPNADEPFTPRQRELLENWRGTLAMIASQQYRCAKKARFRHFLLNGSSVFFATLSGSSIIASLSTGAVEAQWVAGTVSFLAAFSALAQTEANYGGQAEKFRQAGFQYAALNKEINQIIAFPPGSANELDALLADLRRRWDALSGESPVLYRSVLTKSQDGRGRPPELKPRVG